MEETERIEETEIMEERVELKGTDFIISDKLSSVSGGDAALAELAGNNGEQQLVVEEMTRYLGVLAEETETSTIYEERVLECLETMNDTLTVLTFFTIFVWVESKIKNGVRRIMKRE